MKLKFNEMLSVLLLLALVLFLLSKIFSFFFSIPSYVLIVEGNSMSPNLNDGDIIVWLPTDIEKINEGDIIVFEGKDSLVVHRVVEKFNVNGKWQLNTKGDANNYSDQNISYYGEMPITQEKLQGKVLSYNSIFKLPYIGHLLIFLEDNFSLTILLFIVIFIGFILFSYFVPSRDKATRMKNLIIGKETLNRIELKAKFIKKFKERNPLNELFWKDVNFKIPLISAFIVSVIFLSFSLKFPFISILLASFFSGFVCFILGDKFRAGLVLSAILTNAIILSALAFIQLFNLPAEGFRSISPILFIDFLFLTFFFALIIPSIFLSYFAGLILQSIREMYDLKYAVDEDCDI